MAELTLCDLCDSVLDTRNSKPSSGLLWAGWELELVALVGIYPPLATTQASFSEADVLRAASMWGLDVSKASAGVAVRAVLKPAPRSTHLKTAFLSRFPHRLSAAGGVGPPWLPRPLASCTQKPKSSTLRRYEHRPHPPSACLVDAKAAPARSAPSRPGGKRLLTADVWCWYDP